MESRNGGGLVPAGMEGSSVRRAVVSGEVGRGDCRNSAALVPAYKFGRQIRPAKAAYLPLAFLMAAESRDLVRAAALAWITPFAAARSSFSVAVR